jgi:hypothetical protein
MISIIEKIRAIVRDRDFTAKVTCLGLAVFLWAYISSMKTGEVKFQAPLELINLPSHLTVVEMPEQSVDIKIEGKKELVKAVNTRSVRAVVDLKSPRLNVSAQYPVEIIRSQIPESVVLSSSVNRISLTVESKTEKKVRVLPKIIGNVPEGFVIGKYSIEPEFVMISGARSLVEKTETLFTSTISIDGVTEEIASDVEINRDNIESLDISENRVRVTVPLLRYSALLSLELPIVLKNTKKNLRYVLMKDRITLYVKSQAKSALSPDLFTASVDVGPLNPGEDPSRERQPVSQQELDIAVALRDAPDSVEIVSHSPRTVTVRAALK